MGRDWITAKEVAGMLGIEARSLAESRRLRRGPPYYRFGGRVAYDRAEVVAYIAAARVDPEEQREREASVQRESEGAAA